MNLPGASAIVSLTKEAPETDTLPPSVTAGCLLGQRGGSQNRAAGLRLVKGQPALHSIIAHADFGLESPLQFLEHEMFVQSMVAQVCHRSTGWSEVGGEFQGSLICLVSYRPARSAEQDRVPNIK